uniref:DUF4843 domain-containing protein n=2 Tax=unclassified Prevotella TaxID=2638335 RepID=A0AB33IX88_9BACT
MKNKITYLCVALAALMGMSACSNIDYDGEYSEDGYYTSPNQVYFYYANANDTLLNYTFGPVSDTITSHRIDIPVRIAGKAMDRAQTFKVEVDAASTAKAGVHYTALPATFTIAANEVTGNIPVELLRKNLSSTASEGIKLVLRLVNSDDLGVRFGSSNKVTITFDNVLLRPNAVWDFMESYLGIGPYTTAKYRKLLEYYNGDPAKIEEALSGLNLELYYEIIYHIQDVVAYFNAHPEENV